MAGTLVAAPAQAQQVTAEEAIANHRTAMDGVVRRCPEPRDGQEILVCGRREEETRYRAPLYASPDSGPAGRAGGEQRAAMNIDTSRCTAVGRAQQCSGGLPILPIIGYLVRGLIAVATDADD